MKENGSYREKGILLTGIAFLMVVLLATPVMAPPPVVGQGGTVDDIWFEIEGNHSALNISYMPELDEVPLGWDWREADWRVNNQPGVCAPAYSGFGVMLPEDTDPADGNPDYSRCWGMGYQTCTWGTRTGYGTEGTGVLIQDGYAGSDAIEENIFIASGKDFADSNGWMIGPGNPGGAQVDLTNVYAYAVMPGEEVCFPAQPSDGEDPCTDPPTCLDAEHAWLVLAMERVKEEGTFWLDFELNQQAWNLYENVSWDPVEKKCTDDCGPTRTDGDILIGFGLQGNPQPGEAQTKLDVVILEYAPDHDIPLCEVTYDKSKLISVTLGGDNCPDYGAGFKWRFFGTAAVLSEKFGFALMNNYTIREPPWGGLNEAGDQRSDVPEFQFAEAAINLSAFYPDGFGCPGFGSVHAKTRSSKSGEVPDIHASLKDLAGPVAFQIQCSIDGYKWNDLNNDGIWQKGPDGIPNTGDLGEEPTLSDWEIQLGGTESRTKYTDANGYFIFDVLGDGTYSLNEVCEPDWIQSYPSPTDGCGSGTHTGIGINIDNRFETRNFGNHQFGCLNLTKTVDWIGSTPDTGKKFYVNVTGPEDYLETVEFDSDGGSECLVDLVPGEYCLEEQDPGDEWTVDGETCVQVVAGDDCPDCSVTATITNTLEPGCLRVCKDVNDAGKAAEPDATFEICVDGNCRNFQDGDCEDFDNLVPGSYTISETDPGVGWVVGGADGMVVNVGAGWECAQHEYTVTNDYVNLYCGYTIGFWKENIDKFVCNWGSSGRQVCDEFFVGTSPQGDVCQSADLEGAPALCSCNAGGFCENWSCLYDRFSNKSGGCDNAKAQMAGMLLTSQYYADGFNFVIDAYVCKEKNGDGVCDCINDTCVSQNCQDLFEMVCSNPSSCEVSDIWEYIVSEYQQPGCGLAGAIADCVNNYEDFTDCSQYELSYCEPGSFDGSTNNACNCLLCHKPKCYGFTPSTSSSSKKFIKLGKLLDPLIEALL